ncbi:hypothetical protein BJV78DRAFT_946383 [Lactifluus subvellereus]|nr:hypothetical protein BJV78DRAFT_946383 [Lactifluus subvellereus]
MHFSHVPRMNKKRDFSGSIVGSHASHLAARGSQWRANTVLSEMRAPLVGRFCDYCWAPSRRPLCDSINMYACVPATVECVHIPRKQRGPCSQPEGVHGEAIAVSVSLRPHITILRVTSIINWAPSYCSSCRVLHPVEVWGSHMRMRPFPSQLKFVRGMPQYRSQPALRELYCTCPFDLITTSPYLAIFLPCRRQPWLAKISAQQKIRVLRPYRPAESSRFNPMQDRRRLAVLHLHQKMAISTVVGGNVMPGA